MQFFLQFHDFATGGRFNVLTRCCKRAPLRLSHCRTWRRDCAATCRAVRCGILIRNHLHHTKLRANTRQLVIARGTTAKMSDLGPRPRPRQMIKSVPHEIDYKIKKVLLSNPFKVSLHRELNQSLSARHIFHCRLSPRLASSHELLISHVSSSAMSHRFT